MFNIYVTLNYGIACSVTDIEGKLVRMRHGDEVLITRTLYNKLKTEMCSTKVTIANKQIVCKVPRYVFRFEKITKKKAKADDNLQENQ